jgi:hypothetical protein
MNFTDKRLTDIELRLARLEEYWKDNPIQRAYDEGFADGYRSTQPEPSFVLECDHDWHTSPIDHKQYCRHCSELKPTPTPEVDKYNHPWTSPCEPKQTLNPSVVNMDMKMRVFKPEHSSVSECKHEWVTTITPSLGIGSYPQAFKTCRKCSKQEPRPTPTPEKETMPKKVKRKKGRVI